MCPSEESSGEIVNYAEEYQEGKNKDGGKKIIVISNPVVEKVSKRMAKKISEIVSEVWR